MRKPMVMEITGFDDQGLFVGSASWTFDEGWKCRADDKQHSCRHEHEAREWLRKHGAVKLSESDGRKY